LKKVLSVLLLTIFAAFSYGDDLDKKLTDAVKANDYSEVRSLLVRGANPDAKDSMGNTALVMAVNNGNEEISDVLIKSGAYTSESYMRGMSVLMLSINKQMESTAIQLIKYGADTTAKLSNGSNALMMACERNLENVVKEIIMRKQVDLNAKTVQGTTALSIALKERNMRIAKMLHTAGAKPLNLLESACVSDIKASEQLLAAGANIELRDEKGRTPLIIAFLFEDYAMANFLISKGADINARDYFGMAPVLIASMANNGALLALCIDNKADVLVQDINGINALMFLVFFQNDALIDSMIAYNDKTVNCIDNSGLTPLIIAISNGNKRTIEKLVAKGAYINSKRSRRPLNVAVEIGNLDIAKLMLDKGARINAKDMNGNAPLITAASMNNANAVKFLVENGAKTNIRDSAGLTPSDYAKKFSNKEIMSALGPVNSKGAGASEK
jgi:ankyrin repeat protein